MSVRNTPHFLHKTGWKRTMISLSIALSLTLSLSPAPGGPCAVNQPGTAPPVAHAANQAAHDLDDSVATRVIIKMRHEPGAPLTPEFAEDASLAVLMARFEVQDATPLFDVGRGDAQLKRALGLSRIYILTLPSSANLQEAVAAFSAHPAVEYAEPDFVGYGTGLPGDEMFELQWNLHNTGQNGGEPDADVDAPEAWNITVGVTSTVLAIIDTGVDLDHPDLAEKVLPGYDFVNADATPQDDHGHGTHVAGIAAAVTGNTIGVAGVCPACRIMPLKALNSDNWGYYSWWADAIEYAVDHGAHVINMSMGGTSYSQVLYDAVLYAYSANVPIVAAMMNDGDSTSYYPARFAETIAVGATDRYDNRWSLSNFGDHIDLVAPGVSIWSTMWDDTYASWNGTSMATPHVAGALGLVHAIHPDYTVEEVRDILRATADDQVGPPNEDKKGWDRYFGSGRLNVAQAVQQAVPPSAVTLSGPTTGLIRARHTFTATVSPVTAAQPITYVWQATGQPAVTHVSGLSDTVNFTWATSGTQAISVTAANFAGAITGTHAITIRVPPPGAPITVCPSGNCDYDNIQDAVDAARDDSVIKVAAGVYTGTNNYGKLAQVVYISKSVTIRGGYTTAFADPPDPDANPTTVDAQGKGRVLYITGNVSPTIEGLRITGGDAAGLGGGLGGGDAGGGIYVINASAIIRDNQVFSNTARWGGGLYLWESGATLSGNTVADNTARWGGGLYLESDSDATLHGNTITANTASQDGGGLYLRESESTLSGNAFIANTATGLAGGLYLYQSAARLTGNTVSANSAQGGGGLYLWKSDATLGENTVAENVAEDGGGLYLAKSNATLTNTVVAGNRADIAGGGLYIRSSSSRLWHSTIAGNVGDGGGVWVTDEGGYSTIALTNTILAHHSVGITVTAGSTATLVATLWDNTVDWGGAGTIVTGTRNTWGDPAFVDPDAGDYHIGANSAALDAGVDAGVTGDIDGDPRPAGAGHDVGADEFPAALSVFQEASPDPVRAGTQLTYTIRVTNTGHVDLHATVSHTLAEHVTPGGALIWTPVIPAPGGVWTATFAVAVEAGYAGPLDSVLQVTTEEGATGICTETALSLVPALEVSKQASSNPVQAGASLTYTIRIANTGNMDLHATVTDSLPEQVTPGGALTWTPVIPAPGGVWTATFAVAVEAGYAGPLDSVLQVTTEEGATDRYTNTVTVVERLTTVGPSEGGTIVATTAGGATITVEIPPGAVTEATQLAYTLVPTVTGSPAGFAFAGLAFRLEAYHDGNPRVGLIFEHPITVTIGYATADLAGLDENTLELRQWDDSVWSTDGITVVERDPSRDRLVTSIAHLSEFATFAQAGGKQQKIYLPLVLDRRSGSRLPPRPKGGALQADAQG